MPSSPHSRRDLHNGKTKLHHHHLPVIKWVLHHHFEKDGKVTRSFWNSRFFPLGFQTNEHCAKGVLPATPRLAAAEVAIPDGMDGTAPSSNCILNGWNLKITHFLETEKKIIFHPPPFPPFLGSKCEISVPLSSNHWFLDWWPFWGSSLFFPDIYPNKKKQMEFPSTNLDRTHQWYLGPWRVVHLENLPWSFAFSDGFFSRSVRVCTLPATNMAPEKWMVGIPVSSWDGLFPGAMLVLGSVQV